MSTIKDSFLRYFILRPWSDVVDMKSFAPPKDAQTIMSRIKENYHFYLANYFIISLIFSCLIALIAQRAGIVVTLVIVGGTAVAFFTVLDPLNIKGHAVSELEKLGALVVVFLIGMYFSEGSRFLFACLSIGSVLCIGHAVMKQRSTMNKITSGIDQAAADIREENKKTN